MRSPLVVLSLVAAAAVACQDDGPDTIERSTFVASYVDLRLEALGTGGAGGPARKQAILEEHGVTEEDLLEFAEVHGTDASYMRDVWNEVQQKMDSIRLRTRGEVDLEGLERRPGSGGAPPGEGGRGVDGAPQRPGS